MKELLIALLALGTITAFSSDTMSCSGECIYTYPSKKLLTMELEGNPKLKTTSWESLKTNCKAIVANELNVPLKDVVFVDYETLSTYDAFNSNKVFVSLKGKVGNVYFNDSVGDFYETAMTKEMSCKLN